MGVPLSLAMIVKDEELLIGRVLDHAAEVCDEMIVLDTGSTDRTMDIAREKGAEVHELAWKDDFATARNASFAWCNNDWILWLDADDVLPEATRREIHRLKDGGLTDNLDMVAGPYHYGIGEDEVVYTKLTRERIIRRSSGYRWEHRIHECVPMDGARVTFDDALVIEHRPDPVRRSLNVGRNLRILEREMQASHPSYRTVFYYANELFDNRRTEEALGAYRRYLDADKREGPDRYWAWLQVAECGRRLDDAALVKEASERAIAEDPSRAEGYMSLGRYYYDRQQWSQAIPLFVAATAGIRPLAGVVRNSDYMYGSWDYLSVCLEKAGRLREALDASLRALPRNPEQDRIRANMRWIVDHI